MPTVTDDAICIRRWDYSETSQTVSLLLREHGVVRGLVKGAKRAGGSFGGGIEPLTRGEVVAIVNPGRDLATVTEWHLVELFPAVSRELDANRAGLYMADLVSCMLTDHDPHPAVFDAMHATLASLEERTHVAHGLLAFAWVLLTETGYQPILDRDAETAEVLPESGTLAFSAAAGGVVADTGGHDRWRVRRETVELLEAVARGDPGATAVDPAAVRRANRLLAAYIREVLGKEPRAMRWAFPEL